MAQRCLAGALGASQQRQPWCEEEDNVLMAAVQKFGTQRWSQISKSLIGRTSKACSHRWRTYLQPGVKHTTQEPFSEWEIAVVQEAHKIVGNQWSTIARMLPGRTNAAVKNFWYAHTRRNQKGGASAGAAGRAASSGAFSVGSGDGAGSPSHGASAGIDDEDDGCYDNDFEDGDEAGDGDPECDTNGCSGGDLLQHYGEEETAQEEHEQHDADGANEHSGPVLMTTSSMDANTAGGAVAGGTVTSGRVNNGLVSSGSGGGSGTQRTPLRIKLGRGMGSFTSGASAPITSQAPGQHELTMPPPRASVASAGGSPVLRRDGSCGVHPADGGRASYSGCMLQLQGSSQLPLQHEQLGLGLPAHANGAAWMGSSGGNGSSGGGRDATGGRHGVSRLSSSSSMAPVGLEQGPVIAMHSAAGGICGMAAADAMTILHGAGGGVGVLPLHALPLQPLTGAMGVGGMGGVCMIGSTAALPGSPFAAEALPAPVTHAGAQGSAPSACAARAAGGSGRLLSVPSRGLSGLLWDGSGGDDTLCGVGGPHHAHQDCGLMLPGMPSQELLMEAFRDMQGPEGADDGGRDDVQQQQQQQQQQSEGRLGASACFPLPRLLVECLGQETAAGTGPDSHCGSGRTATPGSKRDRAGMMAAVPAPLLAGAQAWGAAAAATGCVVTGGDAMEDAGATKRAKAEEWLRC